MKKTTLLSPLDRDKRKDALREFHEKRDADPKFLKIKAWVQEIFKGDFENLAGFAARSTMNVSALLKENKELCEKLNEIYRTAHYLSQENSLDKGVKSVIAEISLEMHPDNPVAKTYGQVIDQELRIATMAKSATDLRVKATERARSAANARFDKPGGDREKTAAIRAIWASGKYTARDVCAEQECAALNISLSKARKALIGLPNPT